MSNNSAREPDDETMVKDPILDQLLFLAHYFGRSQDAEQLLGGLPLTDGRLSENDLEEAGSRAGLAVTPLATKPEKIKSTMLPALIVGRDGQATVVLSRDKKRVECKLPGMDGTTWMPMADLLTNHEDGAWYLMRPVFYFDERSLLYHLPNPARWFWDTLKANRWIYGWALLATIIINIFGAAIPFFTMAVYDRVVPNNSLDSLTVLATAAVAIVLFDLFSKVCRSYLVDSAARKADLTLSSQIFTKSLKMRAINRPASGGVLANIIRDFESIRDFFTSSSLTLLGDLPFMFFYLALIWMIGGSLVYVPLVLIPAALIVSLLLRRPLARLLDENTQESSQRTAHLFEVMNGLDTIKCLGLEAWARRKWEMLTVAMSSNNLKIREITAFGNYFSSTMTSLATISIVSFGALLIAKGELSMGQLIAVSMLSGRAISPVSQLAGLIVRWQQTKLSLHALNQIMSAPTDEKSGDLLFMPKVRGRVELRDLKFTYPDSLPALKGINLTINPGEKVAFIGRIGSGKSTLIKILLNLYEPDEGVALVDGVATNQIDPHSLRRAIGYVPQDVVLFHGDIRENILAGASEVDSEVLLEAVKNSCLDNSLAQLPSGLATQVGERGERLSGGQRQSVAIARALIRDPKLLLVDEPSSMMDPATENQLIQRFRENLSDTTLILVTHRMAMLPMVDRLVVFNNGQIVADGPRDEVLGRLGAKIDDNDIGSEKIRQRRESRQAAGNAKAAQQKKAQPERTQEKQAPVKPATNAAGIKISSAATATAVAMDDDAVPTLTENVEKAVTTEKSRADGRLPHASVTGSDKPKRAPKHIAGFKPSDPLPDSSANDTFAVSASEDGQGKENKRFVRPTKVDSPAAKAKTAVVKKPVGKAGKANSHKAAVEPVAKARVTLPEKVEGALSQPVESASRYIARPSAPASNAKMSPARAKVLKEKLDKARRLALAKEQIAKMREIRKAQQDTQFISRDDLAKIVGSGK